MSHTVYYSVTVDSDSRQVYKTYCPNCHTHIALPSTVDTEQCHCPNCLYSLSLLPIPRKVRQGRVDRSVDLLPLTPVYEVFQWALRLLGYSQFAFERLSLESQYKLLQKACVDAYQMPHKTLCIVPTCDCGEAEHSLDQWIAVLWEYLKPYVREERRQPVALSSKDFKGWNKTGLATASLSVGIGVRPIRDSATHEQVAITGEIRPAYTIDTIIPLAHSKLAFVKLYHPVGLTYMLTIDIPEPPMPVMPTGLGQHAKAKWRKHNAFPNVQQYVQEYVQKAVQEWHMARGFNSL